MVWGSSVKFQFGFKLHAASNSTITCSIDTTMVS